MDTSYNLTIFPVDSQKRLDDYYAELPHSRLVDGLIILALPIDDLTLQRFKIREIPLLLLESHIEGFPALNQNHKLATFAQTLIKNHRRCAFFRTAWCPSTP
jgi:DNA-binding LacI/PurR family transcriptional regulator